MQLQNGMSGAEIAEKMLADNGIRDVRVISVAGQLTDHYNPVNKTVNLSEAVYNQRNAASAAVTHGMWTCGTTCRGLSMVNYAF
jgi:Zn-dependent membrane protease YugP